jgi:hypothetical protein
MRNRRSRRRQVFELAIRRVNVVREHRARSGQPETIVDADIIRGPRKLFRHHPDLVDIFVDVRLHAQLLMFAQKCLAHVQHRLTRRECEARRYRVQQTSASMKSPNQFRAVAIRALNRLDERRREEPIRQHEAADDP